MRFLPQTILIDLMADSAKAVPTPCDPFASSYAVPATRRAKEMMYELNASPLGEKYDATESTSSEDTLHRQRRKDGMHFLGRALVAADYDVGSMFMSAGDSPSSLSMSGFEAYLGGLESKTVSKASKKGKSSKTSAPTNQPTAAPTCQPIPVPTKRRLDWFTEEEEEILGNTADEEEPWMAPIQPTAELVAKNPGIWKIQDFIDPNLVQTMLETFAYDERFERCNGEPHEHLKCKQCFRLSPSSSRDTEEKELIHELIQKIKDLWPSGNTQRDYLYVQRTEPDCDGTLVHKDVTEHDFSKSATATIVFYLSDGGAGVFFPTSNVIIPPKAGMAVTWLNVHENGSHNKAAEHGIQATPKDAGIRYSLTYRITLSGEEMTAASRK